MADSKRFAARVSRQAADIKVVNYVGLPPALGGGGREPMELTSFLVIVPDEDQAGVYLLRFNGERVVGDTWHEDLASAFDQAEFEFSLKSDEWIELPAGVSDVMAFLEI